MSNLKITIIIVFYDLDDIDDIDDMDGIDELSFAGASLLAEIFYLKKEGKQKNIKKVQKYIFEQQTGLSNDLGSVVLDDSFKQKIDCLDLNRDKELIFIKHNNELQEIYVPIQD